MNIYEWQGIPWQDRIEIRKFFKFVPSGVVKTISTQGQTFVENDGIKEGDIEPIKNIPLNEVLRSVFPERFPKAIKEEPKIEKTEVPKPVKKRTKKKWTTSLLNS